MSLILELAERGWLPDGVICVGIRQLLRQRLAAERTRTSEGAGGLDDHLAAMRAGISVEEAAEAVAHELHAARMKNRLITGYVGEKLVAEKRSCRAPVAAPSPKKKKKQQKNISAYFAVK